MAAERIPSCPEDIFDKKLQVKEPRLPKGIRSYIRKLKEAGLWEEAVKYRDKYVQHQQRRNRQEIAADELHKSLQEMVCQDDSDPAARAQKQIEITWLLNAVGEIPTTNERNAQILAILEETPSEFRPRVEERMPAIRDQMSKFMPIAG